MVLAIHGPLLQNSIKKRKTNCMQLIQFMAWWTFHSATHYVKIFYFNPWSVQYNLKTVSVFSVNCNVQCCFVELIILIILRLIQVCQYNLPHFEDMDQHNTLSKVCELLHCDHCKRHNAKVSTYSVIKHSNTVH